MESGLWLKRFLQHPITPQPLLSPHLPAVKTKVPWSEQEIHARAVSLAGMFGNKNNQRGITPK